MFIGYVSAQKTNITDAAVLMKKYNPMSLEKSKKIVEEAKTFIDKAAVHPETSESMKMHYYKGMIYFALVEMATMDAMSGKAPDEALMEKYAEISKESFLKVVNDTDKRKGYQEDAKSFIDMRVKQYWDMGIGMYETKNYELAMMGFMGAYSVSEFIGVDYEDAKVNAMAMFPIVADSLITYKDHSKAEEIALSIQELFGSSWEVSRILINNSMAEEDDSKSEKYITEAIELNPENKELYYILGTSYINSNENEKAEINLRKALEIDSFYMEAHANIAVLYVNWARELEKTNEGVPVDYFKKSIYHLELLYEENKETAYLDNLLNAYFKIGDYDKAKDLIEAKYSELESEEEKLESEINEGLKNDALGSKENELLQLLELYQNWENILSIEQNFVAPPNDEPILAKKKNILKKTLPYLILRHEIQPDNKSIMLRIAKSYRASGNEEKFNEWYKKYKD